MQGLQGGGEHDDAARCDDFRGFPVNQDEVLDEGSVAVASDPLLHVFDGVVTDELTLTIGMFENITGFGHGIENTGVLSVPLISAFTLDGRVHQRVHPLGLMVLAHPTSWLSLTGGADGFSAL